MNRNLADLFRDGQLEPALDELRARGGDYGTIKPDLLVTSANLQDILLVVREIANQRNLRSLKALEVSLVADKASEEHYVLGSLVSACLGDRRRLRSLRVRNPQNPDLAYALSFLLFVESFGTSQMVEFVSTHFEGRLDGESLQSTLERLVSVFETRLFGAGSTDPASSESPVALNWGEFDLPSLFEELSVEHQIGRVEFAELLRILELLDSFSRSEHLEGAVSVPFFSPSAGECMRQLQHVLDEVELRRLLDWVSRGDWEAGLSGVGDFLQGQLRQTNYVRAAEVLGRCCSLFLRHNGQSTRTDIASLPSPADMSSFEVLLVLFESLEAAEDFSVDDFYLAGEPQSGFGLSWFAKAVQILQRNKASEGHSALVELGDLTDVMLQGSRLSQVFAARLRVVQAHGLMLRGHYAYSLRVATYAERLLKDSKDNSDSVRALLERDLSMLHTVEEGR